ncbi:MAG: hypothetical protein R3344_06455, partial [Acidobacteriota bacterium]|nr:hypothetical protein [Acidobacteriota bacterium]
PAFGCGVETWEFTFSSPTAFTVRGSVTGADGSGTTAADFTSDSGRIRVLAADWVGTFAADDQCSIVTAWRASSTRVVDLFEEVLTNAQAGNLGATELDDSIDDLKGSAVDQPITGYVVDGSSTTILDAIDNVALHMLAVGIEKLDARVGLYAYIPRIESQVSGILCKSDDLMDARIREHTAIYNVFRAVHDYDEAEQRFDGATHFPEEDALNPSLLKYGRREAPREAELRAFGSGNQDWIDSLLEQNYARWSEPREIVTALLKSARLGVEIDELFEIDSEQPTFELFGEPAAISRSVVPRPRMEVDLFEVGFYVQPDDSCGFMFHDSGHRHDDCWTHF